MRGLLSYFTAIGKESIKNMAIRGHQNQPPRVTKLENVSWKRQLRYPGGKGGGETSQDFGHGEKLVSHLWKRGGGKDVGRLGGQTKNIDV